MYGSLTNMPTQFTFHFSNLIKPYAEETIEFSTMLVSNDVGTYPAHVFLVGNDKDGTSVTTWDADLKSHVILVPLAFEVE